MKFWISLDTNLPRSCSDEELDRFVSDLSTELGKIPAIVRASVEVGVACKGCGCTESSPCVAPNGLTCHWVAPELCSSCDQRVQLYGDADLAAAVAADLRIGL